MPAKLSCDLGRIGARINHLIFSLKRTGSGIARIAGAHRYAQRGPNFFFRASIHKHLKSTNMLERINQELKRRTHVIRIFPNEASCLRLVRTLAAEIHEDWIEAHRYLSMEALAEQRKGAAVDLVAA